MADFAGQPVQRFEVHYDYPDPDHLFNSMAEGLAHLIRTFLQEEFKRNLFTKLAGLVAMPVLNAFKKRVDYRGYNGASLLGLRGIVLKSHGSADAYSFECALRRAVEEVRTGMLAHISERMAHLHVQALEHVPEKTNGITA